MNRITNKLALLMMLFLAQSTLSFAEVKLSIENFSIPRNQTAEVSLLLTNDKAVSDFQVDVILPEGLSYVEGSVAKTERIAGRSQTVQASYTDYDLFGKMVILMSSGVSTNTIAAGSGAVLTFQVKASNRAAVGDQPIKLQNIVISDLDGKSIGTSTEESATVKVLGLGNCTFGAAEESFEIAVGEEYQVDITLDNSGVEDLAAISGTLVLPTGLEIVPGEEGKFIYTERTPSPLTFTFPESGNSFLLSSSDNTLILGTSGTLFSFIVKATEGLAESSVIKLTDLRLAATTGNSTEADDVTITVTKAAEPETPTIPGDFGGDGEVGDDDVDTLIDALLDNTYPTDPNDPMFAIYDVNGDGEIDIADAQAAFNLSMGLNIDGTQK